MIQDPILCRIDKRREERNLSKTDFSAKIGMSSSNYGQWLRGDTNSYLKKLPQIAEILDCSITYLLTGETSSAEKLYEAYKNAPQETQDGIAKILGVFPLE